MNMHAHLVAREASGAGSTCRIHTQLHAYYGRICMSRLSTRHLDKVGLARRKLACSPVV